MAEGAGFEPAVHGVDAGFQDRWFQPLTHPSDNVFEHLGWLDFFEGDFVYHPCCHFSNQTPPQRHPVLASRTADAWQLICVMPLSRSHNLAISVIGSLLFRLFTLKIDASPIP